MILRKLGGLGISGGSRLVTADSTDCTSSAAESMSRSSANCTVIWVLPVLLEEITCSMPATVESCRSIGVATEAAIVPGLAPGSEAWIWMVGRSTSGSADTASSR